MVQFPDMLKLTCNSNIGNDCANCKREFMIPVTSVEGVYKSNNDKAILCINYFHYCTHPHCLGKARLIETNFGYAEIVTAFDGNVTDLGSVYMVPRDA